MQRSTERILTTHTGSLPRPAQMLALIRERSAGGELDEAGFAEEVAHAVGEVVAEQARHGVDIVDDGEAAKPSFLSYIRERIDGFEQVPSTTPSATGFRGSREHLSFPEFYAASTGPGGTGGAAQAAWACTGPVSYKGQQLVARDIENLKAALVGVEVVEAFLPAISPSNVFSSHRNAYYADDDEYLEAIALALHEEYQAIVDAGLLLQVDDPQLVTYYVQHPELSVEDCRAWAARQVEVLNHALAGIAPDRVRYHTCYSINMGPRVHDMELKDVVDVILKVNAGAYSFEAANPRHDHEWKLWESVELPEDKVLIPGVITHSSVLVEHPELVAQRLIRYAGAVGRERVIGGSDCGFATSAASTEIHPSIAWAKLDALAEGARLATSALF